VEVPRVRRRECVCAFRKGRAGQCARTGIRPGKYRRLCRRDPPAAHRAARRLRDFVLDAGGSGAQQLRGEVRRCVRRQRLVVPARELQVFGRLAAGAHQAPADRLRVGSDQRPHVAQIPIDRVRAERGGRRRARQPVVRSVVAETAAGTARDACATDGAGLFRGGRQRCCARNRWQAWNDVEERADRRLARRRHSKSI
jgi:hypothetical protein